MSPFIQKDYNFENLFSSFSLIKSIFLHSCVGDSIFHWTKVLKNIIDFEQISDSEDEFLILRRLKIANN